MGIYIYDSTGQNDLQTKENDLSFVNKVKEYADADAERESEAA